MRLLLCCFNIIFFCCFAMEKQQMIEQLAILEEALSKKIEWCNFKQDGRGLKLDLEQVIFDKAHLYIHTGKITDASIQDDISFLYAVCFYGLQEVAKLKKYCYSTPFFSTLEFESFKKDRYDPLNTRITMILNKAYNEIH